MDLSKEAMCGSRAAKDSNDASARDSTLLRVMSPAVQSPVRQDSHKNLEVVVKSNKKLPKLPPPVVPGNSSPKLFDDEDALSTASTCATVFRDRLRAVRLEVIRHKGIIAVSAVSVFTFATYFFVVSVIMIVVHATSSRPEDSVAVRMGFNPINIAITLMAMGVACSALSLALAMSIEDINWS